MEAWDIFKTIAAAVGVIAGVIGSGAAIYKFITDWRKRIANFIRTHGVRGEVHKLEASIASLEECVDDLMEIAKTNTAKLNKMGDELDANTRLTLKLELKSLFRNHPECTQVIEKTIEKYHSIGGDSYIDTLYEEWKESYEKPKMRATLGKGAK